MNSFPQGRTALRRRATASLLAAGLIFAGCSAASAQASHELPRIESRNGRHALIVDGAPFLMLGAQVNNSSNYPAALANGLADARPAPRQYGRGADRVGADRADGGQFDFSFVQTLLDQARAHDKRLVLLWFGTWKNTSSRYTPDWVKPTTPLPADEDQGRHGP